MSLPDPIQIIIITSGTEFNAVVNTTTPQFTASVGSVPLFARNSQTAVTASYALTSAGTITNATSASYISGSGVFTGIVVSSSYSTYASEASASGIVPGTFQSGGYIFPADVTVSGTLRTTGNTIIIGDDVLGTGSLRVSGSVHMTGIVSASQIMTNGTTSQMTSSQAISASYAESVSSVGWNQITGIPIGIVSKSNQIDYTQILNTPAGIISSSIQLPGGIISGTAQLPAGIVSGAAQINSGTFTGSFIGNVTGLLLGSASFAPTQWISISNIPIGIVSSSTQIVAELPAGIVSSSVQINYTNITGTPTGIVSSSVQLPVGLVSSSTQINTGSFAGNLTGTLQGNASTATSASFSITDWNSINNKSVGIVSSSTQIVADLPTGLVSASSQISYPSVINIPIGIISSSTQIIANLAGSNIISQSAVATLNNTTISGTLLVSGNTNLTPYFISASGFSGSGTNITGVISSSYALTASYASNGGSGGPSISSSYATTSSYASIAQNVLGSITSASYAGTDWNAINNRPVGIISASAQVIADLPVGSVSASSQISFAGVSNIPIGIVSSSAQILIGSGIVSQSSVNNFSSTTISGTLLVSGNTNVAPYFISASAFSGSGINITGIISSSYASVASSATSITFIPVSASYATSASAATSITFLPSSASYAGTDWSAINNRPVGLNSSSVQVIAELAGSGIASQSSVNSFGNTTISGTLLVSGNTNHSPYFVSASAFSGSGINITGVISSSYSNVASSATSITFVPASASYAGTDWNAINNRPVGIVSSSTQITANLPVGTVSASSQVSYTSISNIPVGIISSSTQVTTNLPIGTVSASSQISYPSLTNIPVGIVSSSIQTIAGLIGSGITSQSSVNAFSNTTISGTLLVSGNTNVAPYFISASGFSGSGANIIGVISSSYALSASWAPGGGSSVSASYATTSSYASAAATASISTVTVLQSVTSASWSTGSLSASIAPWTGLTGIPLGIVSQSNGNTSVSTPLIVSGGVTGTVGIYLDNGCFIYNDVVDTLFITGALSVSGTISGTTGLLIDNGTFSVDGINNIVTTTGSFNVSGNINSKGYFVTASNSNFLSGTILTIQHSDPAIPQLGTLQVYARALSNRGLLNQQAPSGRNIFYQPSFFANQIAMISCGAGTQLNAIGCQAASSGTVSHIDIPVEQVGYMANIATTATSGNIGIVQTLRKQFIPGTINNAANGFFYMGRFAFPDASASYATSRFYNGLGSLTMNFAVSSGTFATGSWCGFQFSGLPSDGRPSNFYHIVGNAVTSSAVNTGVLFSSGTVYDFYLYMPVSASGYSGNLAWRIDSYAPGSSSAITSEGGNTIYPALSASHWAGAALGTFATTAINMRFQRIYIESDR